MMLCAKNIEIDRFLTELFKQQKDGRFLRHSVYVYMCMCILCELFVFAYTIHVCIFFSFLSLPISYLPE